MQSGRVRSRSPAMREVGLSTLILSSSTNPVTVRATTGALVLMAGIACWHYGIIPTLLDEALLAANLLSIFLYGIDKLAAIAGTRRTPEVVLFTLGCLGGWPSAYIAQMLFRHKTRKVSFQIACIASVLINALLLGAYVAHTQAPV